MLIICGPTGAGKTDFSYRLAQAYPIEIINADIGQFYTPLSIGTAKPAWQASPIPHHLFDILNQPVNLSVTEYRNLIEETIIQIWQRNAIPVIVGGSMFYIKTLFFPPSQVNVHVDSAECFVRDALPSQELWDILADIDPKRASCLHKNDHYRIQRALNLWRASGILPSSLQPTFMPIAQFHMTYFARNRHDLYCAINQRTHTMFEHGWVNEVASLSQEWKEFLRYKKLLGYPDIIACLEHNNCEHCKDNTSLRATIQQKTRNYAKRQEIFWRSLKKSIAEHGFSEVLLEFDPTISSFKDYSDSIDTFLNKGDAKYCGKSRYQA